MKNFIVTDLVLFYFTKQVYVVQSIHELCRKCVVSY